MTTQKSPSDTPTAANTQLNVPLEVVEDIVGYVADMCIEEEKSSKIPTHVTLYDDGVPRGTILKTEMENIALAHPGFVAIARNHLFAEISLHDKEKREALSSFLGDTPGAAGLVKSIKYVVDSTPTPTDTSNLNPASHFYNLPNLTAITVISDRGGVELAKYDNDNSQGLEYRTLIHHYQKLGTLTTLTLEGFGDIDLAVVLAIPSLKTFISIDCRARSMETEEILTGPVFPNVENIIVKGVNLGSLHILILAQCPNLKYAEVDLLKMENLYNYATGSTLKVDLQNSFRKLKSLAFKEFMRLEVLTKRATVGANLVLFPALTHLRFTKCDMTPLLGHIPLLESLGVSMTQIPPTIPETIARQLRILDINLLTNEARFASYTRGTVKTTVRFLTSTSFANLEQLKLKLQLQTAFGSGYTTGAENGVDEAGEEYLMDGLADEIMGLASFFSFRSKKPYASLKSVDLDIRVDLNRVNVTRGAPPKESNVAQVKANAALIEKRLRHALTELIYRKEYLPFAFTYKINASWTFVEAPPPLDDDWDSPVERPADYFDRLWPFNGSRPFDMEW